MKLSEIKNELRKMLLNFNVVKTNNGVLEYEGEEIIVGTVLTVVDAENPDVKELANGEFVMEDGRTLVIESGEVKEIIDAPEVQPVEVVEPEVAPEEEVVEPEAEPTEPEVVEPEEEVVEPEVVEPTELETKVADLETKVAELEKLIGELTGNYTTLYSTVEKMSLAKPAVEEFESVKKVNKTGDARIDRFLEGINK